MDVHQIARAIVNLGCRTPDVQQPNGDDPPRSQQCRPSCQPVTARHHGRGTGERSTTWDAGGGVVRSLHRSASWVVDQLFSIVRTRARVWHDCELDVVMPIGHHVAGSVTLAHSRPSSPARRLRHPPPSSASCLSTRRRRSPVGLAFRLVAAGRRRGRARTSMVCLAVGLQRDVPRGVERGPGRGRRPAMAAGCRPLALTQESVAPRGAGRASCGGNNLS